MILENLCSLRARTWGALWPSPDLCSMSWGRDGWQSTRVWLNMEGRCACARAPGISLERIGFYQNPWNLCSLSYRADSSLLVRIKLFLSFTLSAAFICCQWGSFHPDKIVIKSFEISKNLSWVNQAQTDRHQPIWKYFVLISYFPIWCLKMKMKLSAHGPGDRAEHKMKPWREISRA